MNDITFNILKIVVAVATALISVYIIPVLRQQLNSSKYQQLLDMVEVAVRAAEQTIQGSGMGAHKKDEVIYFVSAWMARHGINITEEQLDQLIEAAVFNMKQEAK